MLAEKDFAEISEEIKAHLRFLADMGCPGFECSRDSLDIIKQWGSDRQRPRTPPQAPPRQASSPSPRPEQTARRETLSVRPENIPVIQDETLESIRADLGNCRRCKLALSRKNIVFGAGNPRARLLFAGEAPGYEEDMSGEPFVGAAGQLLTKIIQAMKLTREDVYICNVVKCRPPGNRNPESDETGACFPFLERQIRAVGPEFVCTLGGFATQTLLRTTHSISSLRGHFHDYMGIKVMPTFHPAFLLRYPGKKRETWHDVQALMKALGTG